MIKKIILISSAFSGLLGQNILAEAPAEKVVLPPIFVDESVHWRHVAEPGFEILSSCPDDVTDAFARQVYLNQTLLDLIVPADLQGKNAVPTTLILLSRDEEGKMSQKIASIVEERNKALNKKLENMGMPTSYDTHASFPQILLRDADSAGADIVWDKVYGDFEFTFDYVFSVLAQRKPPLPQWFVAGVLNFLYPYGKENFHVSKSWGRMEVDVVYPACWISSDVDDFVLENYKSKGESVLDLHKIMTDPPPTPVSDEAKEALFTRIGFGAPAGLSPSSQVRQYRAQYILDHVTDDDSPWRYDLWKSQAALFVRWAFDDATQARRKALWKLVSLAGQEPVTEEMFKDCFGLSFDQINAELSDYLLSAIPDGPSTRTNGTHFTTVSLTATPTPGTSRTLISHSGDSGSGPVSSNKFALIARGALKIPNPELTDASDAEAARILGDWELKEIDSVKTDYPEYADTYVKQAGSTLMGAYSRDGQDPRLLAALGLFECTVGNDVKARNFLEEAVQARVVRPSAYVELARIRLAAALAKPAGAGGKLDRGQVASVLSLLQAVQSQQPPQLKAYALTVQTWDHAAAAPARADLTALNEELPFFPADPALILGAARLDAQAGLKQEAIRLLDSGSKRVSDPATQGLFDDLRAKLVL